MCCGYFPPNGEVVTMWTALFRYANLYMFIYRRSASCNHISLLIAVLPTLHLGIYIDAGISNAWCSTGDNFVDAE
jgi:hypothetical protein